MGNLFDYLEWRGDIPFSVDPFNEVDNLILTQLVYTPFEGLDENSCMVPLEEVKDAFFAVHTEEELAESKRYTAPAPLLMKLMTQGERFRDVKLSWYQTVFDKEAAVQFAAVTFHLPDGTAYVAYRGTDNTLVGWREDFDFSYQDATGGQKLAEDYLNEVGAKVPGLLMVGGHSKGGNLAVYAGAMCDDDVRGRILTVYSNDGPGFREEFLESEGFGRILQRILSILPQSSLFGRLLDTRCKHRIINSTAEGMAQHNAFTWSVSRNRFEEAEETKGSVRLEQTVDNWLDGMADETRQSVVEVVFSLLEATGKDTMEEIGGQKWRSIAAMLSSLKDLKKEQRRELLHQAGQLIKSGTQALTDRGEEEEDDK
ncbi:MAG: DUF2974 domain-containing protein [Lachnospiraceae bacterium]|nr:DUF2974 domain-containing protein [Lachnospiraceae bacterium]